MTTPQQPKPKTALRLIVTPPEPLAPEEVMAQAIDAAATQPPRRPRSLLAQAMTAYADAIDRDIKLLLEL